VRLGHEVAFMADWVRPGALVLPVHAKGWEPRALREAGKFVVDDWAQFSKSLGGPGGFYHPLPELYAQLGEIVTGRRPGRESPSETVFCVNYGMAIHDVAMAAETLKRARRRRLGRRLPLLDGEFPLS
jgi:ornithine cyclodeaminase/alanine dehydrogenase-like protein (mu-crystallin family)